MADNDISVNRLIDFQVLLNLFLPRNMELEIDSSSNSQNVDPTTTLTPLRRAILSPASGRKSSHISSNKQSSAAVSHIYLTGDYEVQVSRRLYYLLYM